MSATKTPVPLDPSLYSIEGDALEFMKASTGIQDPEELKKHILAVQEEAYAVRTSSDLAEHAWYRRRVLTSPSQIFPYPCIRRFSFIRQA